MSNKFFITNLIFLISLQTEAKDPYPKNIDLDVLHYQFKLFLNDSSDQIRGIGEITFRLSGKSPTFELDLVKKKPGGLGMTITSVGPPSLVNSYIHLDNDRIRITLHNTLTKIGTLVINYLGVPEKGLTIKKNKFGDRTFFGDNWPDRAHHWLPCVDHPSDKASIEFLITAPSHYQVVATGCLYEVSNLPKSEKLWWWREPVEVSVKVVTIGVAQFAVQQSATISNVPISTWVFPQNRFEGFSDFDPAPKIFQFFNDFIGPFSYSKLAHVQSSTRFGGLENAGNIFYFENAVNGKKEIENLIAHESAHQWFGNSVTEKDWHHVWLSEGFATYFTHVYNEMNYGENKRRTGMEADRKKILSNPLSITSPIVDTTILEIEKVLSAITYEKASFVLHMLRKEIGEDAFWRGIRNYYTLYKNGNTLTADFRKEMEQSSGRDLKWFFDQWINKPNHPQLDAVWDFNEANQTLQVTITQAGPLLFEFNLELGFDTGNGLSDQIEQIRITSKSQSFSFKMPKKPKKMILDPLINLLYVGKIENKQL